MKHTRQQGKKSIKLRGLLFFKKRQAKTDKSLARLTKKKERTEIHRTISEKGAVTADTTETRAPEEATPTPWTAREGWGNASRTPTAAGPGERENPRQSAMTQRTEAVIENLPTQKSLGSR